MARRVCGRDGVVAGWLADDRCALLPRGAALPRWIRAISQDRDRGRCDHDPILVEMVEKDMCVVKEKPNTDEGGRRFRATNKRKTLNPRYARWWWCWEQNPCVKPEPASRPLPGVSVTVWLRVRERCSGIRGVVGRERSLRLLLLVSGSV